MSIRPQIPAIEGVKDNRVATILGAIKGSLETITGRTPNRPQLKTLDGDATYGGIILKVNEIINRLQETDNAGIRLPQPGGVALDISWPLGGQIKFPATQNPSANVNTLDDYEEGIFTPTVGATTTDGSHTYSAQIGHYTKIGNLVWVSVYIALSTKDGAMAGTYALIKGLPFTNANNGTVYTALACSFWANLAAPYVYLCGHIQPNNAFFYIAGAASAVGSSAFLAPADIGNTAIFSFSGVYNVS